MPDTEDAEPKTMTIGTNNVFEVGCGILLQSWAYRGQISIHMLWLLIVLMEWFVVFQIHNFLTVSQALKIGDNNVIESKGELYSLDGSF